MTGELKLIENQFLKIKNMKKLIVTMLIFVGVSLSLSAQNNEDFNSGWTIGLNGGINAFLGEGNDFIYESDYVVKLKKELGSFARIGLGYNFTPVFTLRGFLGYNKYSWYEEYTVKPKTTKFTGESLTLDALFNLSNLRNYNPDRKLNFLLFAGLGGAYQNDNTAEKNLAGILRGGLQLDYNFSPSLALNLIAEGNFATDNFNDFTFDVIADAIPAVSLGLTYKFSGEKKQKEPKQEVIQPKASEVKQPVQEAKPVAESKSEDVKPAVKPAEKPVEKPAKKVDASPEPVVVKASALNEEIFFDKDKSEIVYDKQKEAIGRVAAYMKKYPNAEIEVAGYADKEIGSPKYNKIISEKRVRSVVAELENTYGVNIRKVHIKWYGSDVQPYSEVTKNRVVKVTSK